MRVVRGCVYAVAILSSVLVVHAQGRTPPPQLTISVAALSSTGTTLFVQGTNFGSAPAVLLAGLPLGGVAVSADGTQLTAVMAALPPGTYLLQVSRGPSTTENATFAVAVGGVGPKGDPGEKGDKGDKGDPGDPGPAGAVGATGPAGANGANGATGATGAQGVPGAAGAAGPAGPQGTAGATGAVGPQGLPGPAGAAGPTGPAGTATVDVAATVYQVPANGCGIATGALTTADSCSYSPASTIPGSTCAAGEASTILSSSVGTECVQYETDPTLCLGPLGKPLAGCDPTYCVQTATVARACYSCSATFTALGKLVK